MTKADWLEVAALVADLWPNQEWSRETIASSYVLVADHPVSLKAALAAVRDMALASREFAPPPGVVATHIKASAQEQHLLADPDLTRDLTPDEQARANEMAGRIKQLIAGMKR